MSSKAEIARKSKSDLSTAEMHIDALQNNSHSTNPYYYGMTSLMRKKWVEYLAFSRDGKEALKAISSKSPSIFAVGLVDVQQFPTNFLPNSKINEWKDGFSKGVPTEFVCGNFPTKEDGSYMKHPKPSDVRDRNSSSSNVNSDPLADAITCLANAKSGTMVKPENEIKNSALFF